MRNQLLVRTPLLAGICLLSPAIASANPNFYGNITPSVMLKKDYKIDNTKADVINACSVYNNVGAPALCLPVDEDLQSMAFGHQTTTTAAGMNFQVSDKVEVNVEVGSLLASESAAPYGEASNSLRLRTYNFSLDTDVGTFIVGRQYRPFFRVTNAADNMKMVFDGQTPGTLNQRRNLGVSWQSKEYADMVSFHLALVNPNEPGPAESLKSEYPTFDGSATLNLHSKVQVALGTVWERKHENNAETSKREDYWANVNGLSVTGHLPGAKAVLTYAMGDALYRKATRLATMSSNSDKNETIDGLNLWVEGQVKGITLAGFVGMENAKLSSKLGRLDKNGAAADVKEAASAYGLHAGYMHNDVEFMVEYGVEDLKYDGVVVGKKDYVAAGANLNWAS